jgi:hypothetical protein
LPEWNTEAWVRATNIEDDGEPDDVLQNHLDLPIYSPQFVHALMKAHIQGIQFLPIKVIRPNGKILMGFEIANILEKKDCLVADQSDFDLFPGDYFIPERRGTIRGLRRAVLDLNLLDNCDIFRLSAYLPNIYVSEKIKVIFEGHYFTGYSFREVCVI